MKTIASALLGLMVLMGVAVAPASASQGWDGQSFWEAREHSWGAAAKSGPCREKPTSSGARGLSCAGRRAKEPR
jgi:hypothetical protein